jgi:hypothetical protein
MPVAGEMGEERLEGIGVELELEGGVNGRRAREDESQHVREVARSQARTIEPIE